MTSVEKELQYQVGTETTWGTPVTATAKLMGIEECDFEPVVEQKRIHDMRGSLAPAHLSFLAHAEGAGSFSGACTYEDACYWLDNILGQATPSGAGPYVRDYAGPLGTAITPRKLTLIKGKTGGDIYRCAGMLLTSLKMSAEVGEALKCEGEFIGKDVGTGSLAVLTDRSVNPVLQQELALYVDLWSGTVGTTAVPNLMWSFELEISAERALKTHLGSLTPDGWVAKEYDVTLSLSLEVETASKAYLDEILGITTPHKRQIRLKYVNGTNYQLQIDVAGVTEGAPKVFDYEDGISSIELEYKALYHDTLANYLKVQSKNMVATLL